ncbi:MAG: pyridoxal 5'-phosphate synthase glutaminase subunit PdxT [Clostridiales bacterium]|jgi:5'-phosphate synthase pdxT subunit|nr:pyridoxal 5'-phosphate synthase glutaminase subunit PdxT [Clostridiales bacterium]
MKIGILALQGAFIEHKIMLDALDVENFEIRQRADFSRDMDGLIIPGGESTVIGKLLAELELLEPIKNAAENGLPIFGACAGMILLAQKIIDGMTCLGVMDTVVRRNAYGRQLGSFRTQAPFGGIGEIPMVFIRAPYITEAGEAVEILATVDGNIVAARQNNLLATAFHPELTGDLRVHQYFLSML